MKLNIPHTLLIQVKWAWDGWGITSHVDNTYNTMWFRIGSSTSRDNIRFYSITLLWMDVVIFFPWWQSKTPLNTTKEN